MFGAVGLDFFSLPHFLFSVNIFLGQYLSENGYKSLKVIKFRKIIVEIFGGIKKSY